MSTTSFLRGRRVGPHFLASAASSCAPDAVRSVGRPVGRRRQGRGHQKLPSERRALSDAST